MVGDEEAFDEDEEWELDEAEDGGVIEDVEVVVTVLNEVVTTKVEELAADDDDEAVEETITIVVFEFSLPLPRAPLPPLNSW